MDLKDKTVMVTGSEGFLGSHLTEILEEEDADIVPVDLPEFDLRNEEDLREALESDPDIVIHLAANVGGIGYNQEHPAELFYDNAKMGIQLMEECRIKGVDKLVNLGTVCAYPKYTEVPFKEEELWEGYPEETNAPYGIAKKMLLTQGRAYREQYGFNSIYLLPVNMYGPKDNFDLQSSHVIPALIRKFIEAKSEGRSSVTAWGSGEPTREFLYVKDCAKAIVMATEKYNKPAPVNIGAGREISIKSLAQLIKRKTGFKGEIEWDTSKPEGQPRRCLDTSRAEEEFGFDAPTSLEEGIENTIEWFLDNRNNIVN